MNNKNSVTGDEQSICYTQAVKWSAVDYRLWYSSTIKKWIIILKPFKHIKWETFVSKYTENELQNRGDDEIRFVLMKFHYTETH
jgi:hypothetical protein